MNGPVTNEGGKTITVAQNPAIFTGMVTNNMNATFNTTNATATFAGGFTNNGNSNFAAVGNGAIDVPVAPAFGNASSLAIGGASAIADSHGGALAYCGHNRSPRDVRRSRRNCLGGEPAFKALGHSPSRG